MPAFNLANPAPQKSPRAPVPHPSDNSLTKSPQPPASSPHSLRHHPSAVQYPTPADARSSYYARPPTKKKKEAPPEAPPATLRKAPTSPLARRTSIRRQVARARPRRRLAPTALRRPVLARACCGTQG